MAPRQTQRWTPEVHEAILVAFVKSIKTNSTQFAEIMADLSSKGYTFTEGALKQHIGKLQKKEFHPAPGTPGAPAPKKTAGKRKAAGKNKKSDSDEEESEAENPRPVKKRATKAKATKAVPAIKEEESADEEAKFESNEFV